MSHSALTQWSCPFDTPQFSTINDVNFEPEFATALQAAREDIAAIANNSDAPSLENNWPVSSHQSLPGSTVRLR